MNRKEPELWRYKGSDSLDDSQKFEVKKQNYDPLRKTQEQSFKSMEVRFEDNAMPEVIHGYKN